MTDDIEKVARALCEHAIIKAYTRQDRVEELAPFRAVEVEHLWRNHIPEAKAAIAAMQQAQQEVIAWRYERTDGFVILVSKRYTDQHPKGDGWTETPLYAFPTPPATGGSDAE